MKFFPNTLLILALILVAAACSSEATSDGSGNDGSTIGGETDAGSKTDTASADSSDAGPDNGSTDVATIEEVDVAKPFCPQPGDPAEATLEIQLADGPQCFVPGAEQTTTILAFVNAKVGIGNHPLANMMPAAPDDGVGGGGCATIHMPNYCFPSAKIYGRNYKPFTWEGGKTLFQPDFYLVITYPDTNPLATTEVAFKESEAGVCSLESALIQGYYQDKVNYSIAKSTVDVLQCENGTCGKPNQYKLN